MVGLGRLACGVIIGLQKPENRAATILAFANQKLPSLLPCLNRLFPFSGTV